MGLIKFIQVPVEVAAAVLHAGGRREETLEPVAELLLKLVLKLNQKRFGCVGLTIGSIVAKMK